MSHPAVHPVVPPPLSIDYGGDAPNLDLSHPPPRVRMRDIQGMPGTPGGLALRVFQFIFAALALSFMASTSDFLSVSAFCFLVAASGLHIIWSIAAAVADIYALMVKRRIGNNRALSLFSFIDGVISTLTFSAACASAGITVLIDNDLNGCHVNHCLQFQAATCMAFMAWFSALPMFLLNFWSLAYASQRT